jgi:PadR family transcriptional regulator PadR
MEAIVANALGEFEQFLILAVLRLGEDAYGVSIRRAIQDVTGRNVSAGAVYTALGRLERRGFVSSRVAETAPERSGQRRKYYRVEPGGAAALFHSYTNLRRMADGVLKELQGLAARASAAER